MAKISPQTMFNGQLNTNELYNAIFNMIISQRLFDIKVAEPTLANRLKVDGTLYGDTKLYYSMDIGESYEWGNDAEAPKLLEINRNDTQQVQKITLDKFRQANVTVDQYLSKRAWSSEGSFAQFNGILISSIGQVKKVFENGYINTYVGNTRSNQARCNIVIDRSDIVAPTTPTEMEAVARITGARISKAIADLFVELRDNERDFNEYEFLRSYDPNELIVVWNAQQKNTINKIDLPMVFNNGNLKPLEGMEMPAKYFGEPNAVAGTVPSTNTGIRSLVDKRYKDASGKEFTVTMPSGKTRVVYTRAGDLLPAGAVYEANETYIQDNDIICKIISAEGNPFLSSMEVGTVFNNARSLTENHYLTWGYNTMQNLKEKPFITIELGEFKSNS